MTFSGLDFLIGVAAAIVCMALVQAAIDHFAGPDPDLAAPWFPDRDTPAPLPQRPEPVRGFAWQGEPVRRAGVYRPVADETESERGYGR